MGGREAFIGKLDSLFVADSSLEGELVSADISGLIGQYAHGNEPSHHIIHFYNYVGQPWRTQELVDEYCRRFISTIRTGFRVMKTVGRCRHGMYWRQPAYIPLVRRQRATKSLAPVFDEVRIRLDSDYFKGKEFVVRTRNNSKTNCYIQRARLNGKEYDKCYIDFKDIVAGRTLELIMGDTPGTSLKNN